MFNENTRVLKKYNNDNGKTIIIFGDNVLEAVQIIDFLLKYNKDKIICKEIEFISVSEQIYVYEINGEIYNFIAKGYYHNGELPTKVRHVIKELDKPDAVVYSVEDDKVLMGFESTATGLVGNATWQRTGRIINFIERNIPFAFLAYYSKKDQSNPRSGPRVPSYLFNLMFIATSLKYHTPALLGLSEHDDPSQQLDPLNPKIDMKKDIFKYLLSLILKDGNEDIALEDCYKNMRNYYFGDEEAVSKTNDEFGVDSIEYIRNENFPKSIVYDMRNKVNHPLFGENLNFEWSPINWTEYIHDAFPDVKFLQLSKNCTMGITFETEKLVNILNSHNSVYVEDFFYRNGKSNLKEPTVVISFPLTKGNSHIFTSDPYNGAIPAFAEMYKQSFPKANILIHIRDHSVLNEYDINSAKGQKVYKAITKYADIVIDKSLKICSKESERAIQDEKNKYLSEKITEDEVTSLLGTLLNIDNYEILFINPPSGSWSDINLYPYEDFYYVNRDSIRADVVFYNKDLDVYFVGESKDNYSTLRRTLSQEEVKTKALATEIKSQFKDKFDKVINTKTFVVFSGTPEQGKEILNNSNFDSAFVINEEDKITLTVIERE